MSRIDVLRVRGNDVGTDAGLAVAQVTGGSPNVSVLDPDGEPLLRVEKDLLDPWYARRPDDWAILRIDPSLTRFHTVTYADGRTGRFDAAPTFGAWQLADGHDGRPLIHTRSSGELTAGSTWECAQDGSLTLLDFLATVVTYREVVRLRRERVRAADGVGS